MDTIETTEVGLYACHLIACALRNERAGNGSKPANMTWRDVFAFAKRSSVEAITWMGLPEHPSEPIDEPTAAAWSHAADLTLLRQLTFDEERAAIGRRLMDRDLSFMALKGPHTCTYYPAPGMRSMSDNDVMYAPLERDPAAGEFHVRGNDAEERTRAFAQAERAVRDVMGERGYTVTEETKGDLSFVRLPFLLFEMVQNVAMPRNPHYGYYANPWRRAVPADPAAFQEHGCGEMRWPIEDEYLFHLSHMFKHYDEFGGCGIRFAVDEYVFLQAMRDADWAYVRAQLKQLDLADFERRVRRVACLAFGEASARHALDAEDVTAGRIPLADCGDGACSESEDLQFLRFLFSCGTYGTMEFKIRHDMDKASASRSRYVRERLFPSRAVLISTYPWLERKPWLIPFMPVYRLVHGVARNGGKLVMELRFLLHGQGR